MIDDCSQGPIVGTYARAFARRHLLGGRRPGRARHPRRHPSRPRAGHLAPSPRDTATLGAARLQSRILPRRLNRCPAVPACDARLPWSLALAPLLAVACSDATPPQARPTRAWRSPPRRRRTTRPSRALRSLPRAVRQRHPRPARRRPARHATRSSPTSRSAARPPSAAASTSISGRRRRPTVRGARLRPRRAASFALRRVWAAPAPWTVSRPAPPTATLRGRPSFVSTGRRLGAAPFSPSTS